MRVCLLYTVCVRALYKQSATFRFGAFASYHRPHLRRSHLSRARWSSLFHFCLSQSLYNADAVHYLQLIELNQSINFQFSRTISDKYNFFFGYACRSGSPIKNHFKWLKYAFHAHLLFFFSLPLVKYSPIFPPKCTHQPAYVCVVAILWIVPKICHERKRNIQNNGLS